LVPPRRGYSTSGRISPFEYVFVSIWGSPLSAAGRSEKFPFDTAGITLEEAIARAGKLNDYKADPGGVFLLRFEPVPLVAQFVPGTAPVISGVATYGAVK
jgi:hypothetical protein